MLDDDNKVAEIKSWINNNHSWAKNKYDSLSSVSNVNDINTNNSYNLSIQNYPNPFNSSTRIKFTVPEIAYSNKQLVSLKIFDLLGRKVATIVNDYKESGEYEVEFNAEYFSSCFYYIFVFFSLSQYVMFHNLHLLFIYKTRLYRITQIYFSNVLS